MKSHVLQLNPILVPAINDKLDSLYHMHRLFEKEDKDAWIREHGDAVEGVITGGHTGIANTLIDRLPALKVIAVNGVGTDAVDLAYARSKGIPVTGTFGALTEDVADLAIALMLTVCRQICPGNAFVKRGDWVKHPHPGAIPLSRRLSGKRVGIVGMGKVGRAIAQRAAAFGCPINYTDLRAMDDLPHRFVPDLIQLARESEVLVLAAAADKAQGIINASVLDALGRDGYLINIARGKLVVERDLVDALERGVIAGAGLDVFADEPNVPPALLGMDQVVLQAHRASATVESRTAMGEMVLASLAQGLAGQRPDGSLTT
ncbi:2-hydroxyacid dehydrogenase [Herbaspirillum robiniae]|uniref:Dihydrofolate reductase n=1 Tax=Herbaspirillum robiniae TaxID=2014887 RepID=A0A246WLY5_9BURK|nr:2-hydroxyacid dehydrogenase [Herbaspirillum robiniae]OWY27350.1 dihydrofolate reductase [Herbaspirillum robiniae]